MDAILVPARAGQVACHNAIVPNSEHSLGYAFFSNVVNATKMELFTPIEDMKSVAS